MLASIIALVFQTHIQNLPAGKMQLTMTQSLTTHVVSVVFSNTPTISFPYAYSFAPNSGQVLSFFSLNWKWIRVPVVFFFLNISLEFPLVSLQFASITNSDTKKNRISSVLFTNMIPAIKALQES